MTAPFVAPSLFELSTGQTLHLHLARGRNLWVEQGRVSLQTSHCLVDQAVRLTTCLEAGTVHRADASAWLQVTALPGVGVRLQVFDVPSPWRLAAWMRRWVSAWRPAVGSAAALKASA